MSALHLTLTGEWVACHASQRACPRLFHLPGMTPGQAAQMPPETWEQLAEIVDPPSTIRANGTRVWLDTNQMPHRDHDLPAVVYDGSLMLDGGLHDGREWHQHGVRHRGGDRPAVVLHTYQAWYRGGRAHRDHDRPAVIRADGTREWWQLGQIRRESGGPTVVLPDGTQIWTRGGSSARPDLGPPVQYRHRPNNLPAVIHPDGREEYWRNNKLHRVGGPARHDDQGRPEYWLDGHEASEAEAMQALVR